MLKRLINTSTTIFVNYRSRFLQIVVRAAQSLEKLELTSEMFSTSVCADHMASQTFTEKPKHPSKPVLENLKIVLARLLEIDRFP